MVEENLLKECQRLGFIWGRSPLNRRPKYGRWSHFRAAKTGQPACGPAWAGWEAGYLPEPPGLVAGLGWPGGWPPSRTGRPWSRPRLAWRPGTQLRHENFNIFFIRTPISMILGSLESQRRALQDYAEKHHSPSCEDKTK